MRTRPMWWAALTGTALAVAVAGPSAAQTQTIDAKANPDAATAALNSGCVPITNCSWKSDPNGKITVDYGPPAMLGDVLYNCNADTYSETEVGISDLRENTTSLSERVSLKVSLGLLGFEKSSAEFSVFSKQANSVTAAVEVTTAVTVPPGSMGWSMSTALSANVTGSAYITQGITQLQVSNIDLSFPGYQDPSNPVGAVVVSGKKRAMSADEIKASCDATAPATAQLLKAAQAPSTFALGLCGRSGRCASRTVKGKLPPDVRQAGARLTRAGRTYAIGTHARGRTRLQTLRALKPGRYTLTLRERPATRPVGLGAHRSIETIVPVTVR